MSYGRNARDGYAYGYSGWAPYVPVAKRRANAAQHAQKLMKKTGETLSPLVVSGRTIAGSF